MTDSRKSFSGRPSLSVHSDRSGVESASPDAMGGAAWALRNAQWMVLTSTSVCFMAKSGCFRVRGMRCGAEFRLLDRFMRQRIGRNQRTERVQSFAHCRSTHDITAETTQPGANIRMFDCRESRLQVARTQSMRYAATPWR